MLAGCVTTTTGSGSSSIDEAATRPLNDVGIVRRAPDPVLAALADAPYALTEPVDCASIRAEVAVLDSLLGPDIDSPSQTKPSTVDDLASGAVGGLVDVPFRGVIRRLSGSDARDKALRRAILAGQLRRAFLKGFAVAEACPAGVGPSGAAPLSDVNADAGPGP